MLAPQQGGLVRERPRPAEPVLCTGGGVGGWRREGRAGGTGPGRDGHQERTFPGQRPGDPEGPALSTSSFD